MVPDQTAPVGAVCSGSTLFTSILNSSLMLGNFCSRRPQQATFSDAFFLCALRVKNEPDNLILCNLKSVFCNFAIPIYQMEQV